MFSFFWSNKLRRCAHLASKRLRVHHVVPLWHGQLNCFGRPRNALALLLSERLDQESQSDAMSALWCGICQNYVYFYDDPSNPSILLGGNKNIWNWNKMQHYLPNCRYIMSAQMFFIPGPLRFECIDFWVKSLFWFPKMPRNNNYVILIVWGPLSGSNCTTASNTSGKKWMHSLRKLQL